MPMVDLPDDALERAARAARLAAGLHERGAEQDESLRPYFIDQARRYRALAKHLETIRRPSRAQ
jgi:hypothetical protein